jgi:nicotinamidase-related amidase
MPVTALDPKTALIAIDLQKGIVSLPAVHPIEGVIKRVSTMAAAFRKRGLPVVLVTDAMTDRDAEALSNSVTRIFTRIGETGMAQEVIDLLEGSA